MSENKKGLLNENTIRRFMKLAEIDTLSDQFVGTLAERYGDEDLEEGMPYQRDDEGAEEPAFDMADEEEGAEDLGDELPPEPEEAPAAGGDAEAIFTDIVDRIIDVAGEHGVEMSRDGEEGEEAELGGEEDLDMAPDEGLPAEEEEAVPGVELEEDLGEEGDPTKDEDEMVAEITRRVTARLMKESRNEQVADQLADRIMARLKRTSKK